MRAAALRGARVRLLRLGFGLGRHVASLAVRRLVAVLLAVVLLAGMLGGAGGIGRCGSGRRRGDRGGSRSRCRLHGRGGGRRRSLSDGGGLRRGGRSRRRSRGRRRRRGLGGSRGRVLRQGHARGKRDEGGGDRGLQRVHREGSRVV
ncbi:MAG: hypothetical protein EKK53_22735 [Burkholderiales bacterium]|nr:MAG: hypothetical protein EKK53_22735 [Burkholderiales bacterium]